MTNPVAIGVDWCNGAWLGVMYQNGEYTDVVVAENLAEMYRTRDSIQRILIDIPIGLFADGGRKGSEQIPSGSFSTEAD